MIDDRPVSDSLDGLVSTEDSHAKMSCLICIIVFVDPDRMFEKALISVSQSLVEFFFCNRAVCLNAKKGSKLNA